MLSKPKGTTFRFIAVTLIFFFGVSFAFPKESLAYRSRDGGGEVAEFDFGKWAAGAAIGMASSALGGALVSGLGSAFSSNPNVTFLGSFSDSLGLSGFMEGSSPSGLPDSVVNDMGLGSSRMQNLFSTPPGLSWFDRWGTNLVISTAVGQVQNATGMMGTYYGWDPRSTIFISSIAGAVVGGGLSPGHFGSSLGSGLGVSQTIGAGMMNTLEGMGIGLVEGTIEGAILMSAANKKGQIDPLMQNLANLTGSLVTGGLAGGLTGPTGQFSFTNIGNFDFTRAAQSAMSTTLRSIPSAGISMGVQSITKGMDKQDAAIVKSAFSGVYYLVNVPTGNLVDNNIIPSVFGEKSRIPITNTSIQSPILKETSGPNSKFPPAQSHNQINWGKSYKDYTIERR